MSKYDDTFRDLLYQLTEGKPSAKTCPAGEVWDPKQGKCIKKKKNRWDDSGGVPHGGINEGGMPGHMDQNVIEPDAQTWNEIFSNYFIVKKLDQVDDKNTWNEKSFTVNIDNIPFDVFQTPTGVVIPDPEELASVHFFEGGTVDEIYNALTV
jgi:hypothetical protein